MDAIGVTSSSFAKNSELRACLEKKVGPNVLVQYLDHQGHVSGDDLTSFLWDKRIWLVGREPVSAQLLSRLPHLQLVTKYGVGIDNIDQLACKNRGIQLHWQAGVNAQAVAELAIAMMISLSRNMVQSSRLLSQGVWRKDGGRSFAGSVVGIIGFGHVGQKLAHLLRAFGCPVLYNDIVDKTEQAASCDAKYENLEVLLRESQVVSLHVPLTPETKQMIGERELKMMKKGSFLINTCRGQVVDQNSLRQQLKIGHIGGAGLDVYEQEPVEDKDLYSLENFLGTPHIGGNSREAVLAMGQAAINGISLFYQQVASQ